MASWSPPLVNPDCMPFVLHYVAKMMLKELLLVSVCFPQLSDTSGDKKKSKYSLPISPTLFTEYKARCGFGWYQFFLFRILTPPWRPSFRWQRIIMNHQWRSNDEVHTLAHWPWTCAPVQVHPMHSSMQATHASVCQSRCTICTMCTF